MEIASPRKGLKKKDYDYLAKIVIIGNSSVGKTNLLLRFVQEKFSLVHTPTIGLDFRSKIITVPLKQKNAKKKLKLQLWDTAGQQRFRTLTDTYFKGASGIIITYAINDRRSYQDIMSWIMQLESNGVDKTPKIIVGNKCDLREDRKVSCEEGKMVASQYGCTFMEVSAKEDINITQMFNQLSMSIINNFENELAADGQTPNKMKFPRRVSNILINEQVENKDKKRQCC